MTAIEPGDVVRVRRNGRTHLLEVTEVIADAGTLIGWLPYATTYQTGGQYEGSYRGTAGRWTWEVVEVVRHDGLWL